MPDEGSIEIYIEKVAGAAAELMRDRVAIEEPLEIRLDCTVEGKRTARSISITMRTPGNDEELAVGFLFGEGILRGPADVRGVRASGPAGQRNVIRVELQDGVAVDLARLRRHFYTTSSCGVCGKASLEALTIGTETALDEHGPRFSPAMLCALPEKLRQAQAVFAQTGGLHAAALYNKEGELLGLREDVGRHNAVDKLIGAEFLAARLPRGDCGLLLSGRASFELMQKALAARIPLIAAVGAPSSLAVELAVKFKMTLIGFLRDGRFNIYNGGWRVER